MKNNYGLTNTELLIMELLWKEARPMSFREIMDV
ncbi:MAG: transcriptional regulator, partial [Lachnospiraceae bacterium]|nr:transcriptional regulator [Lachnospiraceae bacterium]